MNKKKVIGTIVGVCLFVLMVAGATYAWIVMDIVVSNGNYATNSRNFGMNFTSGQSITSLQVLNIKNGSEVIGSGAASVQFTVALSSSNSPNGNFSLNLVSNSSTAGITNIVKADGPLMYSVQIGTETPTNPRAITNMNEVLYLTPDSQQLLINSATDVKTIKVYMWLDSDKLTSFGNSYSGYISASAVQVG